MKKSIILEMTTNLGRGEQLPPKMRKIDNHEHWDPWSRLLSSNDDVIFVSAKPGTGEEIVIKKEPKDEIISDNDDEDESSDGDEEEDDDEETVESLLREWELEYELRALFEKFRVTLEVLQNLKEEDLKVMIPDHNLATRVLLRASLVRWQKANRYGPFEMHPLSTTIPSIRANQNQLCRCKLTPWQPPFPRKRKLHRKAAQRLYEEAKAWLKDHDYPWFEAGGVLHKWHQSFLLRRTSFMSNEDKEEAINQWPILWTASGHKLIESDFNQIYADKSRCLFEKWDQFYKNFLPMLDTDIMETYGDDITTLDNVEMRNCLAVQLINSFMKPSVPIFFKILTTEGNKKTNYYQPSVHDARTSFFIVVSDENEARLRAAVITRRLQALGLSRQPLIFGIGHREELVKKFFVIYDQLQYTFKSFLKALDIVFKVYHVFNLQYNKESMLMWVFIQRYFYNIVTPKDVKSGELNQFIARLMKCDAESKKDSN